MNPPISLDAFRRIVDTKRRIERIQWRARAEIVRAQLAVMRSQVPA